jgi:hypothetical protein
MRRYILSDILTASALVLLVSFSTTIVQIALAQGNLSVRPSSNTTFSPAAVKDLIAKILPPKMVGAVQTNNYSAWLFICKAPSITNIESDCDTPTRLH